jgi:hypothetical protein
MREDVPAPPGHGPRGVEGPAPDSIGDRMPDLASDASGDEGGSAGDGSETSDDEMGPEGGENEDFEAVLAGMEQVARASWARIANGGFLCTQLPKAVTGGGTAWAGAKSAPGLPRTEADARGLPPRHQREQATAEWGAAGGARRGGILCNFSRSRKSFFSSLNTLNAFPRVSYTT